MRSRGPRHAESSPQATAGPSETGSSPSRQLWRPHGRCRGGHLSVARSTAGRVPDGATRLLGVACCMGLHSCTERGQFSSSQWKQAQKNLLARSARACFRRGWAQESGRCPSSSPSLPFPPCLSLPMASRDLPLASPPQLSRPGVGFPWGAEDGSQLFWASSASVAGVSGERAPQHPAPSADLCGSAPPGSHSRTPGRRGQAVTGQGDAGGQRGGPILTRRPPVSPGW